MMPIERMVALVVVLFVALIDYVGFIKPAPKPATVESIESIKKEEVAVSPDVNGSVSMSPDLGRHRLDEPVLIPCEIKNTGTEMHTFVATLDIKGPRSRESLPIKRISLDPGQSEEITFEYRASQAAEDGRYSALLTLWNSEEHGKFIKKYAQEERSFTLFDALPEISFLDLGLSAKVGERLNIKIRARDDRGVKWVRITYKAPGMLQSIKVMMKRVSGIDRDNVWAFTTDPSRQTGQFAFIVEAMDTKSQIASTEEYRIAIITDR